MDKRLITAVIVAVFMTAGAYANGGNAKHATKQHAKITIEQARATALKEAPGKVKSEELEKEHGKLIYSFDIATSAKEITEVNVDAMNGKVVAVQHENVAKDAAEKKQEAKEKTMKP